MNERDELLRLLANFSAHIDFPSGLPVPVSLFKQIEDLDKKWYQLRVKLEALLTDHVSRRKLEKLIEEFPKLDLNNHNIPNASMQFVAQTQEWKKRLVLLTEKGGE